MALFSRRKRGPAEAGAELTDEGVAARPPRLRAVGDLLRETRQAHGGDIEGIAEALRIRPSFLVAIEEGRFDQLPGTVYALGFVRAYAFHLGLDGDEAVRRFKQETAAFEGQHDLSFPVPLVERSIPGGAMVLVAVILAVCGYGLWYYLSAGGHARPERVSAVPVELAPPAPAPTPAPAPPPTEVAAVPAPEAPVPPPVALTPVPPPAPAPPALQRPGGEPATAAEPPSAPPPPAPTVAAIPSVPEPAAAAVSNGARVYGVTSGPVRIVVRALSDSWVQVRDSDQSVLATRVLRAGDSYRVPDKPGLTMRTGNGSGLEIIVDGKTAPALGGALRRNVVLEPNRLLAGSAVAE